MRALLGDEVKFFNNFYNRQLCLNERITPMKNTCLTKTSTFRANALRQEVRGEVVI